MYNTDDYPMPHDNTDFQISKNVGLVKAALEQAYLKSSYMHVSIEKYPIKSVFTTKAFSKPNSLKLVPLSNMVGVSKDVPTNAVDLGVVCRHQTKGHDLRAYIKSHLAFPAGDAGNVGFHKKESESFLSSYWALQENYDPAKCNCERCEESFTIKIGPSSVAFNLPYVTNTVPLQSGDKLVVLKAHEEPSEPAQKQAKTEAKGGKGKKFRPQGK